ncbi:HAD family hydrolase [Phytoactinopolyspora halotolerans]|uniref:HAD-IB family hydrolase n=1 Tax=Phytoactinopolyspora halotolerans TaxID=1981512 RepID=A0A6L9S703_9ACTN|nr:HAD-IB family hydrolase [Phytoactinopolyspora halotolerans]NEE00342.1 HAD-IB family hydrolase [Phytoactinopolyspora halotolerans]
MRLRRSPDRYDRVGVAAAETAEVTAGVYLPPDSRAAAFFDLDNTLLRGASLFYLARGLYEREFFRTSDIVRFGYQQTRFLFGAEDPEHMDEARNAALMFIAGRSVAELSDIGEEIFDERMAGKIWPGTQAIARMHIDQGQRVWLVTAAPAEIATIIAQKLGLTGALGTVAEHLDGYYTGRLVGDLLHGEAKAAAVRSLAAREGLDLGRCSAYSDSANDIPLLSLVGHPCAVNPDRRLRAHARRHGWRVRDYRGRRRNTTLGVAAVAGAAVGSVVGVSVARRR